MIDLTKIDKPFGELDQVTQWALKGAYDSGEGVEYYSAIRRAWVAVSVRPRWAIQCEYRLKPEPAKQTVSFEMGVSAYPNIPPLISAGHAHTEDWQHGTATVDLVDGKATRIVWEPSK